MPAAGTLGVPVGRLWEEDWRVAAYRAPRPRRLDAEELRILDILEGDESSQVDAADPVEPRPLPGDLTSGNGRPPPAGACGGGPGIAVRLDSS